MKTLITTLILIISFSVMSQATIFNGHIDSEGEIVDDYYTELSNKFQWSISIDRSDVTCYVYNSEGSSVIDTLSWDIKQVYRDTIVDRYTVSSNGMDFYLDFQKEGKKSVIIFNQETLYYSIMEGEGVKY